MTLRPVLMLVPADLALTAPQRVQRQRDTARCALDRCAALCGIEAGDWPKDADDAPSPRGGYHWSIAHKPTCVVAVIADRPVGIDVERTTPRRGDLFEAVGDDEEWRILGGRNWPAFYRAWTAKEATLKAHGLGIGHLPACRVIAQPGPHLLKLQFRSGYWCVEQFELGEHLAAVTAVGREIRWHVEQADAT